MASDSGLSPHPLAPTFSTSQEDDQGGGYETVVGFVGASPRAGYIRVYASLAFLSYCELAASDVAQSSPLDSSDLDGPTVVRVSSSAHLEFVRSEKVDGDADYVMGAVRASYRGPTSDSADEAFANKAKTMPLDPVSVVYPPCPPPITPVLYCLSDVYPPC